jgi:yeast amino acid transporter
MIFTFLKWKKACEVQGLDRTKLPYTAWGQPWSSYYALTGTFIMTFVGGYTVFLPGFWDVPTFLFSYTMIGVFPILFFGWKFLKKTSWHKPHEVNLTPKELAEVDEYEANYVPRVPP